MPSRGRGLTPRRRIEAECRRRSRRAVVAGCAGLVDGADVDPALLLALGGPGAQKFLDGGQHDDTYWLRVWGTRGLLWAWDDSALEALSRALDDESWRVREMACKVVARNRVGGLLDQVTGLRDDPVPRVAAAAQRAVVEVTAASA